MGCDVANIIYGYPIDYQLTRKIDKMDKNCDYKTDKKGNHMEGYLQDLYEGDSFIGIRIARTSPKHGDTPLIPLLESVMVSPTTGDNSIKPEILTKFDKIWTCVPANVKDLLPKRESKPPQLVIMWCHN